MRIIIFSLILFLTLPALGQGSYVDFYRNKAKEKMDQGNYAEAINDLYKVQEKLPNDPKTLYDIANCYYRMKNYNIAIEKGKAIINRFPNYIDAYRIVGNSYDISGNYEEGVNTLIEGIEKNPYEGELYLDLGIIEMLRHNYAVALKYWEQGIKAEPYLADNYYWATTIYAKSNQKIWALLYGEHFLNIEKNSDRTVEISKTLLNTYLNYIKEINGENTPVEINLLINEFQVNEFEQNFRHVFKIMQGNGLLNLDAISKSIKGKPTYLRGLGEIRSSMVQLWVQTYQNHTKVPLFDWLAKMQQAGYLESYSHWLMMSAEPDYFIQWQTKSSVSYSNFLSWYYRNPLKLNVTSYFSRLNFIRDINESIPQE